MNYEEALTSFYSIVGSIQCPITRAMFHTWATKSLTKVSVFYSYDKETYPKHTEYGSRQQFFKLADNIFQNAQVNERKILAEIPMVTIERSIMVVGSLETK